MKSRAPKTTIATRKGDYAFVNGGHGCIGHLVYDEDVGGYRRDDDADHHGDGDHDAKPYGIETELLDNGKEDGVARIMKARSSMNEPPMR